MQAIDLASADKRYAKCIEVSKRIRWDIDRDVIRGRQLRLRRTSSCPTGCRSSPRLRFLHEGEARLMSQIQGRTYANMFGLVERFIGAKMLDVSRDHALGDQVALRGARALHRRGAEAPGALPPHRDDVAAQHAGGLRVRAAAERRRAVSCSASRRGPCSRLTCHIEIFTQVHYRAEHRARRRDVAAVQGRAVLPLARGVAARDPRRARMAPREDAKLTPAERDAAVDDLIALVAGVDGLLQMQATADARYFAIELRPGCRTQERGADRFAHARRVSLAVHRVGCAGAALHRHPGRPLTPAQMQRIGGALAPLVGSDKVGIMSHIEEARSRGYGAVTVAPSHPGKRWS